jgi:hypothetical protein
VSCFTCGEEGHISPNCPSKSKTRKKGRKTVKEDSESESKDQSYNYCPPRNPIYDLTPKDKRTSDSDSSDDTDEAFTATATVRRNLSKNSWILDSGATSHMCSTEDKIQSLIKSKLKPTKTAGNEVLQTKGQGTVEIKVKRNLISQRTITLKEVKYIPDLRENLISISKLAKDGLKVEMDKKRVLIRESSGAIVAKGRLINGLYVLYEED